LIRAGEILLDGPGGLEGASREFAEKRHPRTGIGFSKDSTIVKFVVVDGRQSQSDGMTLREFTDLMLSLELHHALNLDGGGSTTMVVGDRVVNSPSDAAGERPVANAILLLERSTADRE
jgi:exopolysaccharide biosynthesis protein